MLLGACGSAFAVLACTKGFTARIPPGRCSRASKLVRGLKVKELQPHLRHSAQGL